ncbi:MAG: 50S ribosomal protein L10 [Simkaniaceae bacterium]|nr:50S ribosomal protein L10 [Simkaniaceae bacterium]
MRAEKTLLLDEIKERGQASNAVVLFKYMQLNPNRAHQLRQEIMKSGGRMTVASKRMILKAFDSVGIEFSSLTLDGHVAFVTTGKDSVETTKVLCQFQENNQETLQILGGYFEGKVCSKSDVVQISKLPGKDEMRAQLLGLFEAPMSQLVGVMDSLLTSVPYCLENKSSKES